MKKRHRKTMPAFTRTPIYMAAGQINSGTKRNYQQILNSPAMCKLVMGFTLVEVIIVLMIIGIVALVVVPMHASAAATELKTAADMVASDLEYAKSMAISTGKSYSVVFDTTADGYCIKDSAGQVITHPVHIGANYAVSFAGDGRLDKVNIVSTTFGTANTIKFDNMGSPFDGTGAALNNGIIQLAQSQTMEVKIEPVTGYISIE